MFRLNGITLGQCRYQGRVIIYEVFARVGSQIQEDKWRGQYDHTLYQENIAISPYVVIFSDPH